MASRLKAVTFTGPAGNLEGLWKEAGGTRLGSAVFAHPHPLHGGTLHNKVVFRAARALTGAGYGTLRFNFRGVGLSQGRGDAGRGEVEDFRAALDEAERLGGLPIVAGDTSEIVVVPDTGHSFEEKLAELERGIARFLAALLSTVPP